MILNDVVKEGKNLYSIDNYTLDFNFNSTKNELNQIINRLLDKGSDYVIKSLPIPDQIKNVLTDVKESFKKDGFKNIVKTAVDSSIEEGLQLLGLKKDTIKDINRMLEIANKGGLLFNLEAGVEILKDRYCKYRIPPRYLDVYLDGLNNYILSNEFTNNIQLKSNNYINNINNYIAKCTKWYNLYSKKKFNEANELADELNKEIECVKNNNECVGKNQIIQNITRLSTNKNERVSELELQLCHNF